MSVQSIGRFRSGLRCLIDRSVQRMILLIFAVAWLVLTTPLFGKVYYVSPSGSDSAPGTIDQPFLTITKANSVLVAGDTIYVRGGLYSLSATISLSSKTGADSTKRCYLLAYPGERPVLDFTAQTSSDGLKINGSYWYVRGIECQYAYHNGIAVNGSRNIIENCSVHDNRNTGLQLGNGASYNRIINCDSYFNFNPPSGGDADGFAPKLDVGTGNYFYGCRSWQNSDDGWDGYLRPSDSVYTTIENCWSFMNGYLKNDSASGGNGNGFKMGGGDSKNGVSNGDSLRHYMTLKNCLCFDNRVKGFDQNNDRGSMTLLNCTAYRNGTYNFSIPGIRRVGTTVTVINCISLGSTGVTLLNPEIVATNSWMSPFTVTTSDFVSLDTTGVRGPRKPDGSLPDITFMHLAAGSQFIDAGTNVGLPFLGSAPDLGAFEREGPVSVLKDPQDRAPGTFVVVQNYPNPFNPDTRIGYRLTERTHVTLIVYDLFGRVIRVLVDKEQPAGVQEAVFNGAGLASGVYIARLQANRQTEFCKMVLLK
jgi:hypothetical protein